MELKSPLLQAKTNSGDCKGRHSIGGGGQQPGPCEHTLQKLSILKNFIQDWSKIHIRASLTDVPQNHWQYQSSDTLRRQNTRRERVEEGGMNGEKVK